MELIVILIYTSAQLFLLHKVKCRLYGTSRSHYHIKNITAVKKLQIQENMKLSNKKHY
jgi:hypothetical protein